MEPYLTIREVAGILRLSEQTIQRYVLKKEIPYLKIRKVIRFRPAEIEEWAEKGGIPATAKRGRNLEGDLFAGVECCPPEADSLGVCSANSSEIVEAGTAAGEGDNTGKTETGAEGQGGEVEA